MAARPTPINAHEASKFLKALTVKPSTGKEGYSRAKFPHWIEISSTCDTRETVLKRDGKDVHVDAQCRAVSGTWESPYDGATFDSASKMDIDHVVPLAEAWRSGANLWTPEKRRQFANDLDQPQLVAVSAGARRSKGDQTPNEWKPPARRFWCEYGRAYIQVKHFYHLSIESSEKDALIAMLETCDA
ncbi:hypothetical protein BGZ68_008644 [Mortierella alpina]|nr:hypothetical protein BGZ68_008644 [Mortierella alpina]